MSKTIWSIVGLLLLGWVAGLVLKVAEGAIHLLLVPAGLLAAIGLLRGGQRPATE